MAVSGIEDRRSLRPGFNSEDTEHGEGFGHWNWCSSDATSKSETWLIGV